MMKTRKCHEWTAPLDLAELANTQAGSTGCWAGNRRSRSLSTSDQTWGAVGRQPTRSVPVRQSRTGAALTGSNYLISGMDLPDLAAGSIPITLGDFKRRYVINDRMGVRVLRAPYTAKPYVLFYTTKRVGGGVLDPNAIRLLKIAA